MMRGVWLEPHGCHVIPIAYGPTCLIIIPCNLSGSFSKCISLKLTLFNTTSLWHERSIKNFISLKFRLRRFNVVITRNLTNLSSPLSFLTKQDYGNWDYLYSCSTYLLLLTICVKHVGITMALCRHFNKWPMFKWLLQLSHYYALNDQLIFIPMMYLIYFEVKMKYDVVVTHSIISLVLDIY